MRMKLWTAAVVISAALAGCTGATVPEDYTGSSGTLAISRDDALLYAARTDSDTVAVVDAASNAVIATVPVGKAPTRLTVGPDDTVYVANRGSRSISVIKRGTWEEASRVEVGVEPAALQVSADNSTLYVVNSTSLSNAEVGTLTAVDVKSLQVRWEVEVGHEPRGLALVDGGRTALVSLFKQGDVVKVDLEKAKVVQTGTKAYDLANASSGLGNGSFNISTFHPRGMNDLAVARRVNQFGMTEFERVFAPVIWAREDEIATPPNAFGGYYANGGPCNTGSISTSGLLTFEGSDVQAKVDDLTSCTGSSSAAPDFPSTLFGTFDGRIMQGPVAVVSSPTGDYLWVLNRETQNVAVMRSDARLGQGSLSFNNNSVRFLVNVGQGADGIALSRDGSRAFVHNQFDHTITRIEQVGSNNDAQLRTTATFKVGEELLPVDVAAGRKLFHDAADTRLSAAGTNVACSQLPPRGPRGRPRVDVPRGSPPDAVHGRAPAQPDRALPLGRRVRGPGRLLRPHRAPAHGRQRRDPRPAPPDDRLHGLAGRRRTTRTALAAPSDAQLRGQAVFQKANCNSCHSGQAFTDNTMQDVGTAVTGDKLIELNVPSLLHALAHRALPARRVLRQPEGSPAWPPRTRTRTATPRSSPTRRWTTWWCT